MFRGPCEALGTLTTPQPARSRARHCRRIRYRSTIPAPDPLALPIARCLDGHLPDSQYQQNDPDYRLRQCQYPRRGTGYHRTHLKSPFRRRLGPDVGKQISPSTGIRMGDERRRRQKLAEKPQESGGDSATSVRHFSPLYRFANVVSVAISLAGKNRTRWPNLPAPFQRTLSASVLKSAGNSRCATMTRMHLDPSADGESGKRSRTDIQARDVQQIVPT